METETKPLRPGRWSTDCLQTVLDEIEADAKACEKQAVELEEKKDKLNAYLMNTQAMAHRLDLERIKRAFAIKDRCKHGTLLGHCPDCD
jgi:hypothetical protein